MLDPTVPLPAISPDAPAGPNLEFDTAFSEFERAAQGKPEQQYGATVVPGYGAGPDLSELVKLVRDIQRMVTSFTPAVVVVPDAAEPAEELGDAVAGEPVQARASSGMTVAALTAITNRADAIRLLDLVMEYYERHEPSSPLPLLIGRARRLADKGFLDLIKDLAPDGFGQVERIAGPQEG